MNYVKYKDSYYALQWINLVRFFKKQIKKKKKEIKKKKKINKKIPWSSTFQWTMLSVAFPFAKKNSWKM